MGKFTNKSVEQICAATIGKVPERCYNQVMKEDVIKLRHERSLKDYPGLALEDDEFVELEIKRSRAGLVLIWGAVVLLSIVMAVCIAVLGLSGDAINMNASARNYLLMLLIILMVLFIVAGLVLSYVYKGNRMYVTNHRIIRYATDALFAHSKNVINLVSVEDVSFRQNSIIQNLLRYGTIRLSTVGDETTYSFPFVDTPTDELDIISHLVHVAKEEDPAKVVRVRE